MERKAMNDLVEWKNSKNRKPLLIYGARQVGKTYLVQEFGTKYFKNMIIVNFEKNTSINSLFENDLNPDSIIKSLEIYFNERIDKENTLIFFDEIQKNPKALTSLKYFSEDAPDYHIIAAGSLLGVHLKLDEISFPVGKVNYLTIYPLSFDEFLYNTGNSMLISNIKESFKNNKSLPAAIHQKALDLYTDYLIIGGMPEVVNNYISTNSVISAIEYQRDIIDAYKSDITKYSKDPKDAIKIVATFESIPIQLAKDNKKFQYKVIQKGGTSTIFGNSIDWLVNANIALKCLKTNIGVPLKMHEEIDSFKLYMLDVGLLTNMCQFPIYMLKSKESFNEMMIGMITENYVASSLSFNNIDLHYWKSDYDSEIDFVVQSFNGKIIPIEVKSSDNIKSKSLSCYIEKYKPQYSIRISTRNFGFKNNIKSVPLYAVFCLTTNILDEM